MKTITVLVAARMCVEEERSRWKVRCWCPAYVVYIVTQTRTKCDVPYVSERHLASLACAASTSDKALSTWNGNARRPSADSRRPPRDPAPLIHLYTAHAHAGRRGDCISGVADVIKSHDNDEFLLSRARSPVASCPPPAPTLLPLHGAARKTDMAPVISWQPSSDPGDLCAITILCSPLLLLLLTMGNFVEMSDCSATTSRGLQRAQCFTRNHTTMY